MNLGREMDSGIVEEMQERKKSVLVTGVGVICSTAKNYDEFVAALRKGVSGAAKIEAFDTDGLRNIYGCEVRGFEPSEYFGKKDLRRMDRSSQLSMVASREAVLRSGLDFSKLEKRRCGVSFGSTIGGMVSALEYFRRLKGNRIRPSLLLDQPLYSPGTRLCIEFGIVGPNIAISTACSSGNVAIGCAYDLIQSGRVDVMLTGGFDTMAEITYSGFGMMKNSSPDVCRPFDKNRNGLILGEGAACLVLEEANHCTCRGAELTGRSWDMV